MTKKFPRSPFAFGIVTILFFAWGFITSNNDPLIAAMRAIFSLSYTEALLTQSAFFAAFFAASLPAAALLARIGAVSGVLVALATMVVALLDRHSRRTGKFLCVRARGALRHGHGRDDPASRANPLAASLGPPDRSHFRLTLAQAFNSLGVVLGVNFGSQLMLSGDIFAGNIAEISDPAQRALALSAVSRAYFTIAIALCALIALIWIARKSISAAEPEPEGRQQPAISMFAAFRDPMALLGALAIFMYVGAEVSIASVMINFLNRPDVLALPLEDAGHSLAVLYWGGHACRALHRKCATDARSRRLPSRYRRCRRQHLVPHRDGDDGPRCGLCCPICRALQCDHVSDDILDDARTFENAGVGYVWTALYGDHRWRSVAALVRRRLPTCRRSSQRSPFRQWPMALS